MTGRERKHHTRRERCRACDGRELERFLELGRQPLANSLLGPDDDPENEMLFPLDVWLCRSCSLVQLLDVVDPEILFGHYLYLTGTSATMSRHFEGYARAVTSDLGLGPDDLVVEVASNDGCLLGHFAACGVRTLGVEPARNVAPIARERGVETINAFFDADVARDIRRDHGAAAAVVANNVLAHVDDTRGFLRAMASLVRDDGVVVVEVPAVGELLDGLEYDTIYHEHLCYFSVTALARLFEAAGLRLVRVDDVPVHGGSLRLIGRPAAHQQEHGAGVAERIADEAARGLTSPDYHHRFATAVAENRVALRELLRSLADAGHTLAAYGAPAKGNTLLNYCGIGPDLVAFTVDKNPLKVGRLTPGMHLPVLEVAALLERRPDYVMILPWNLADEIMKQEAAYAAAGGRFIVPIPKPRIVERRP